MGYKRLLWLGVFSGFLVGVAVAGTFAPGDAGQISDGVLFTAPDGPAVTVSGSTNISMSDMFPNKTSVSLETEAGNLTLSSANRTNATVHTSNITGKWTNVSKIDANTTTLKIRPEYKQRADVNGSISKYAMRNVTVGDNQIDFYLNGTTGNTTVTLYDLPPDTSINAIDAKTGNTLDSNITTSSGKGSFEIAMSSHNVILKSANTSQSQPQTPIPLNMWLFIGIMGTTFQLVAVGSMLLLDPDNGSIIQFFVSVLSFICYGVFTYGSLNVMVVGDAVTYQFQMPAVTMVGVALTVSSLFLVLSEPLDAINTYRQADIQDL